MTPEEKKVKAAENKARREDEDLASITGPRAGVRMEAGPAKVAPIPEASTAGLELSEVMEKPLSFFRPDPENAEFDKRKDGQKNYWTDLKRDIGAVGILNPLVVRMDGTVVFGHSRLRIAGELGLSKIPCRMVLSPLAPAQIRTRRRMDNLLRFELDEDTRLAMLAEAWPEYYLAVKTPGRPTAVTSVTDESLAANNGLTVAPFSGTEQLAHGDTISTATAVSEATGRSLAQTKRDRATVQKAAEIAKEAGKAKPDAADIKAAREVENAKRREATKQKPLTPAKAAEGASPAGSLGSFAPDLTGAGKMLNGWYMPGGNAYRLGLEQALIALSTYNVISPDAHDALLGHMKAGLES